MENASKALLMAASILIAMMVIGIGTYVFNIFGTFSKNQEEELYSYQISEFNAQFTKYETMEEITIHDIITLANYAKDYNQSNGITDTSDAAYIQVNIQNIGLTGFNLQESSTDTKNTLIKTSIDNKYKYELISIDYNTATSRVNRITFTKKN